MLINPRIDKRMKKLKLPKPLQLLDLNPTFLDSLKILMKRRAMAQNTAQSDTKTFLDDFLVSAVVQESAEH